MMCDFTDDELALYADGELDEPRGTALRDHLAQCGRCRDRLAALWRIDGELRSLRPAAPSAQAVLRVRKALAAASGLRRPEEILTLEETAALLRLTGEQLGQIMDELPAFELAGQVRVRRQRLFEWVEQREREYSRQRSQSWLANAGRLRLGVAG